MKKLFAVIMMLVSVSAFAGNTSSAVDSAGFAKLSEAEKAEIIKMVADKASRKDGSPIVSEDKVEKWVNIGSKIGQGLAGQQKKLVSP